MLAHKHIQPDSSTGNERPALLLIYSALEYRSRVDVFFSQLIFFLLTTDTEETSPMICPIELEYHYHFFTPKLSDLNRRLIAFPQGIRRETG